MYLRVTFHCHKGSHVSATVPVKKPKEYNLYKNVWRKLASWNGTTQYEQNFVHISWDTLYSRRPHIHIGYMLYT